MAVRLRQLERSFLKAVPKARRSEFAAVTGIGERIAEIVAAGAEAWPQLSLTPTEAAGELARRLAEVKSGAEEALGQVRAGDTYLACAMARGDEVALEAFELEYMPAVRSALTRRINAPTALIDDVVQTLRQRLVMGDKDQAPLILKYSGQGQLKRWLITVGFRMTVRLLKREPRAAWRSEELLEDHPTPEVDPELAVLKGAYREKFQQALQEALGRLDHRERQMLVLHVVDGLTVVRMAEMYGVHRRTIDRWLARTRNKIYDTTRDWLVEHAGLDPSQVDSIRRLVQSRIEVSLRARRHHRRL